MVRVFQKRDIDRVAEIWLECNQKAHDFIPADYWMRNFDMVKAMLPQAEVYVYENDMAGTLTKYAGTIKKHEDNRMVRYRRIVSYRCGAFVFRFASYSCRAVAL